MSLISSKYFSFLNKNIQHPILEKITIKKHILNEKIRDISAHLPIIKLPIKVIIFEIIE